MTQLENHEMVITDKEKRNSRKVSRNLRMFFTTIEVYGFHQKGLVRSPFQKPMTSPVSPTHSLTPLTTAFAIPAFCVPLLGLFFLPSAPTPEGVCPGVVKLLPVPVAYSDPMDGSTFSPAESDTKRLKGTSHTHRPKYEAISVKVGMV